MTGPNPVPSIVRFAVFDLDLTTGDLRRQGVRVKLQEQPFRVLAMLVGRPGELVTREALREALWPDAVFVDFDHGLNKAVAKIRRALGDLPETPRYVETLERRGYRFIAPVERVDVPAVRAVVEEPRLAVRRLHWGNRTIPLPEGNHLIGRDPGAQVWIDSSFVSRHHASIDVSSGRVTIEDRSKNGTFVNGQAIAHVVELADGDAIGIGPARLTFRCEPTTASTATAAAPVAKPGPRRLA